MNDYTLLSRGPAAVLPRGARRRFAVALLAGAALACLPPQARAADAYPNKVIRLVVPYAPGGITDVSARVIAEFMTRRLGQQVIVDNHAGASGNIGVQLVAAAPADGYTILLVPDNNILINPRIYPSLPPDPMKDLAAIGKVGDTALVMLSSPSGQIRTVKDVIAAAKAAPEGLSFGTSGAGSNSQIVGEMLKQRTGANLVHVAYKGGGPAITDLMGNQIPLVVTAVAGSFPFIKSGKVRAIAVATPKRSASLPDTPTFIESGVPNFYYNSWLGLFAPIATPKAVIERLNAALNEVLPMPEVKDRFAEMGIVPAPATPQAFTHEIAGDFTRFGPVVAGLHISVQ
ncbi:MAG TPA: tripartite tricarboxylate transporter substrate binding protein [Burkholderiales bacterium]|nr:tripartite tricarboxylate transporter substrate binding protein [Burkholderiales bacterium]